MSETYFPVQSSIPSARALAERIISRYPIEGKVNCYLFSDHLNTIYLVKGGSRPYYLRVSRLGWRSFQDIEEEIHLLNLLHDNGVSVALPVKASDGSYIQSIETPEGTRFALLFHNAPGKPNDVKNREQNVLLGRMSGKIHRVTDDCLKDQPAYQKFHLDLDYLLHQPIRQIVPFIQDHGTEVDYLNRVGESLSERLKEIPRTTPEYGILHGDLHSRNVHFDDQLKPTLFDFDCFGYGMRAYDIGVYLYNLVIMPEVRMNQVDWMDIFNQFLEGYNQEKQLKDYEFNYIKMFGLVRHIWGFGLNFFFYKYKGVKKLRDQDFIREGMNLVRSFVKELKLF